MTPADAPPGPLQRVGLWLGPVVFGAILLGTANGPLAFREAAALAGASWMAVWWITEAVPMGWTALLPLALWPILGVHGRGFAGDAWKTASVFLDAYLFLFLGGMALGLAMELTGLHRRIALHVLNIVGDTPQRVLFGVLLATMLVSLWISNTATAVMMVPIAAALVRKLEDSAGRKLWGFGAAVLLSVAYGANLGGIGTKIGSGTNSIFCGFVSQRLGIDITFVRYVVMCLPFVILFLPVVWLALWRVARVDRAVLRPVDVRGDLALLGAMGRDERLVAVAFGTAAVLWMSGDLLRPLVTPYVPVFWEGFKVAGKHWEATVAMVCGTAPFLAGILRPSQLLRIPWSALALLGGSFAMAGGIEGSGLSQRIGESLAGVASMPILAQALLAAGASVALSAVASNTATVTVLLQVLPPALPVLTATAIGASCDFALPAGTPPNAIVFGTGWIRLPVMVRVGVVLDIAAVLLLAVYAATWLQWVSPG